MTDQWIVLLDSSHGQFAYGPTEDEDTARDFAAFLTSEVDSATPLRLRAPTAELLSYWRRTEARAIGEFVADVTGDPEWYVRQQAAEDGYQKAMEAMEK